MKNYIMKLGIYKVGLIIIGAVVAINACNPGGEREDFYANETMVLKQWIEDNNYNVEPTASGLYYIETTPGTGGVPIENQYVQVKYKGTLLDGTIFDEGTFFFMFNADKVVNGFDEAISYMKPGGKAMAIMPSFLAYGASGSGSIEPYSSLIFELELIKIFSKEQDDADKEQYFINNSIDLNLAPTDSGLFYIVDREGTGPQLETDRLIELSYHCRLLDSTLIDSGEVIYIHDLMQETSDWDDNIKGWDQAIGFMKKFGKSRIIVPSENLFLDSTVTPKIEFPDSATLVFDVELLNIQNTKKK